jgi:hypothetical protein
VCVMLCDSLETQCVTCRERRLKNAQAHTCRPAPNIARLFPITAHHPSGLVCSSAAASGAAAAN